MEQIKILAADKDDRIYHTFIKDMLYSLSFSFTVKTCDRRTVSCFLTREYHHFLEKLYSNPVLIIEFGDSVSVIRDIEMPEKDAVTYRKILEITGSPVVSSAVSRALCEISEKHPLVYDFYSKRAAP